MSLVRAIAHLVEQGLKVRCFADDLANKDKVYPWIEPAEIDKDKKLLGCGPEDYVQKGQAGKQASVKVLIDQTTIRFTVHAASTAEKNGGEIADEILDRIEALFESVKRGKEPVAVIDPVTNEDQHVTGLAFAGRNPLPPDTAGEPFVYGGSATYRFTHRKYRRRDIDHAIQRVEIRCE